MAEIKSSEQKVSLFVSIPVMLITLAIFGYFTFERIALIRNSNSSISGNASSSNNFSTTEPPVASAQFSTQGLYPQASERILTRSDISGITKAELEIMKNEIFARHGLIFKSPEMSSYFSQQSWYQGLYEDVTSKLTDIEKQNIALLESKYREGVITGDGVRMRSSMDKTSKTNIIDKFAKGTPVEILERNGEWVKVRVKGKVGYIASQFVE